MIEKVLIDKLEQFIGCPVCFEVPADSKTEFVVLEKTGSSAEDHVYVSTVAIQSYSDSMEHAADLNDLIKHNMLSAVADGDYIISVMLNSDYNYTDTTEKRYRYQAVFDITHYEEY